MEIVSPRLRLLKKQLNRKNALREFWDEIETNGSPLIETSPKHQHRYITFLYRELESVHNVVVVLGPARVDFKRNQMYKFPSTDIWYRTYEVREDAKFQYLLSPDDPLLYPIDVFPNYEQWGEREANFQIDALNKTPYPKESPLVSTAFANGDHLPQNNPECSLEGHTISSDILDNERRIWVYTPPNVSLDVEYPILVMLDGELYPDFIPVTTIINRLVASSVIDPIVAVLVENIGNERENEFGCNVAFSQFLSTELMDFMKSRYPVRRSGNTICGFSMGGVCASYTALCYPRTFHNVISASGSYFWNHPGEGEPAELIREFVNRELENVNFYLECGLMEDHTEFQRFTGGTSTLQANRHFRDVLISKGYQTKYREYNGGHDWINWADTLQRGLLYFG
jgi:enterochelin esterase family protein